MSEPVQTLLPILVPLSGAPIPVRLQVVEQQMIERLKRQCGLSRSEIIRRAVRFARLETARQGESNFLAGTDVHVSQAPDAHRRAGRKPRTQKISELQKTITTSLRTLERAQKQLEHLERKSA